jgi:hypothetical protein
MAKLPDETLFDYVRVYDLESRVKQLKEKGNK